MHTKELLLKFIEEAEARLKTISNDLNWNDADLEKEEQPHANPAEENGTVWKTCSFCKNHRMPTKYLTQHEHKCKLKRDGIDPDKMVVLPSSQFAYEAKSGVVELHPTLEEIPKLEQMKSNNLYNLSPPSQQQSQTPQPFPPAPHMYPLHLPPNLPPPPFYPPMNYNNQPPPFNIPFRPGFPPPPPQFMPHMHMYQQPSHQIPMMNDMQVVEDGYNSKVESIIQPGEKEIPILNGTFGAMKRFIESWKKIPASCKLLDTSVLDQEKVKSWLKKTIFKYTLAFDDQSSQDLLYAITIQNGNDPDKIVKLLYNKIGTKTPEFVMELWKYLAMEILQIRHQQLVAEGKVAEQQEGNELGFDLSKTQVAISKEKMTREERLEQYLHDVAVANQLRLEVPQPLKELNVDYPSLPNPRKQGDQSKSKVEVMQEMRNNKRRRQNYRAKNIHITKRTPTQIARDVIALRMEEIGATEYTDMNMDQQRHKHDTR